MWMCKRRCGCWRWRGFRRGWAHGRCWPRRAGHCWHGRWRHSGNRIRSNGSWHLRSTGTLCSRPAAKLLGRLHRRVRPQRRGRQRRHQRPQGLPARCRRGLDCICRRLRGRRLLRRRLRRSSLRSDLWCWLGLHWCHGCRCHQATRMGHTITFARARVWSLWSTAFAHARVLCLGSWLSWWSFSHAFG